ncbi:hypothetical protein GIB67_038170 [Kingdonia uniflora]|uniref:Uncharacterized protein n=1 Tax=Kingdonia uniflora TaxID=39325 RepID=A0A7J7MET5_9MAGN|nr:hypothetical protein GIB67_038170 [Kingdonia uniflora]
MKSETSTGSKDPFGSLLDFGIKKQQPVNPNASFFSEPNFDNLVLLRSLSRTLVLKNSHLQNLLVLTRLICCFPSSSAPAGSNGSGYQSQMFSDVDDWGVGSEFGGNDDVGSTTELDGLPPLHLGLLPHRQKNKGLDSQKQGQHADAIKYLSWAVFFWRKLGIVRNY